MFDVIVSTTSTGRVRRRRFESHCASETWVHRVEAIARRYRLGLWGIRVEILRVA